MTEHRFTVQHQPDESRYALIDSEIESKTENVIGEESYLDFDDAGAMQRIMYHTEVSEDYSGQGLASILVREAVDNTVAAGYSLVPVCPYVATWLRKHPAYSTNVVKPRPDHLNALRSR